MIGRLYDATGRLVFDGTFDRTWRGGPPPYGFDYGKSHLADGDPVTGHYVRGALDPGDPSAIDYGEVRESSTGKWKYGIAGGQTYPDVIKHLAAVRSRSTARLAVSMARSSLGWGLGLPPLYRVGGGACVMGPYPKRFARSGLQSIEWSGPCAQGKAHGNGILITRSPGGTDRYEGEMFEGHVTGKGDYTWESAGGVRFVGEFVAGAPVAGKLFEPGGALRYEGTLDTTWTGGQPPYGVAEGKWFFSDSTYLYGWFAPGGMGTGAQAPPAYWSERHAKDGTVVGWKVGSVSYASQSEFIGQRDAADNRRQQAELDRWKAESDRENQAWREAERQRKQAETAQILGAIGDAIGQLTARRSPPAPAPAPGSPSSPPARTSPELGSEAPAGGTTNENCTAFITSLQRASQSWIGNANDVAARLGRDQRLLFQGPCRQHPQAAGFLASADRMIGYGGDPGAVRGVADISLPGLPSLSQLERQGGVPTQPDQSRIIAGRPSPPPAPAPDYRDRQRVIAGNGRSAMDCVRLERVAAGDSRVSGGGRRLVNGCAGAVEITWCYVDGDCQTETGSTWTIRLGGSWPVSADREIRWAACHGANTVAFEKGSHGLRYVCRAP